MDIEEITLDPNDPPKLIGAGMHVAVKSAAPRRRAACIAAAGSRVTAQKGSIVRAYDGSIVIAQEDSIVYAYDGSIVYAYKGSVVHACDGSRVEYL